jgi:hypothetical protein
MAKAARSEEREERLDAAIAAAEEEEMAKAARSEERIDAAKECTMRPSREALVAAAAAAARRKDELPAAKRKERRKERLCSHVGCVKSVRAKGVCKRHGPRCSHEGCKKDVVCRGVCGGHDNLADAIRRNKGIFEG